MRMRWCAGVQGGGSLLARAVLLHDALCRILFDPQRNILCRKTTNK